MTTDSVEAIVAEILSGALRRPVAPGEAISRDGEEAWDSLKHMEIVFAVESAFDCRFDEDDIVAARSAADIVRLVGRTHEA